MIQDREQLLSTLAPTSEVLLLNEREDGLAQISAALAQRRDLDAIHFVTHGSDRLIKLGDVWLSSDTLPGYADQIAGWQSALAPEADLLFYACNLASGEAGQGLLESIHQLTGADIAASTNDTGHAQYRADWVLEYQLGAIETGPILSQSAQDAWAGLLVTVTVTNATDIINGNTGSIALLIANTGGDGISLREAIIAANNTAGLDTIAFNIPGTGIKTISLFDPPGGLPSFTSPVVLDATTQPGYAGTPLVELNVAGADEFSSRGLGVASGGAGSTIRGLAIYGYIDDGIVLEGGATLSKEIISDSEPQEL